MPIIRVQTGLRLEYETYLKLKTLSDRDGRSINNMAEFIIRKYIADFEEKNGPVPFPPPEPDED